MIEMLFATGIPFGDRDGLDDSLNSIKNLMPRCAGIRQNGAAALDLAYVAAGRFDGYWERGLKIWDIAAGLLIVKEAGGTLSKFDGTPVTIYDEEILVSNGLVHQEMVDVLEQ